jgi:lipopolysaccharide export system protein LptA
MRRADKIKERRIAVFHAGRRRFRLLYYAAVTLVFAFLFSFNSHSQVTSDTITETTKIYLVRAETQDFNKLINSQRQVLKGNVIFRHDSSYMYCDSAYFYEQDVSLEAFGVVRMEQGDTLFVHGDYLFYDGKTEMAKMRRNVRMVNVQKDSSIVTLYTDSLDYSRITNIGYYFDGGRIVDQENELISVYGQYSTDTKIAVFHDSVRINNPDFTLYSDTLEYSTDTKIATILGPSIIESDSGVIHSSRGWFNTQENTSLLLDRSQILSGNRTLTGDSIAYDKTGGIGQAFGDMSLTDTAQNMTLTGNFGYYDEKTEYALATDSAQALEYSQGDTLFIYADTFQLITIDSTSRILKAYRGVRFYRSDIQGVCDSMRFDTKDSVLHMYGNRSPAILWNAEQQLFGDSIIIYMADTTVDHIHVPTSAFVVQAVDAEFYNQLGGNDLKAYFTGKNIDHIDIDGNAESIFYPLDKDSTMIGHNHTQSAYLSIWMKEGKLSKLKIWPTPKGKTTPIFMLSPEEKTLKKFAWYADIRPKDRYDIFRFYKKHTPDNNLPDSIENVLNPDTNILNSNTNILNPDENFPDSNTNVLHPNTNVPNPGKNILSPDKNVLSPDKNILHPDKNIPDLIKKY